MFMNSNTTKSSFTNPSYSSSSSSSSPSPKSNHNYNTMEEVWKDINLSSLHNNNNSNQNPNFILQDFLAKDPPQSRSSLVSTTTTRVGPTNSGSDTTTSGGGHVLFESSPVAPPPPPPPPPTALSLCSGPPGLDFFDHPPDDDHHINNPMITDHLRPLMISSHLSSHHTSRSSNVVFPASPFGNYPLEGLDASSALMTSLGSKRVLQETDTTTGDRRQKRMIKNRESAARSRARKQAYTNELELEVQHLMEENTRLRRQQEELRLAADSRLPRKRTLYRASTAPF